ncbi:uncharacterized protein [Physcomitrium patens]|uniref:uncharacterized protein isoform X2 n=1 Tax=Physcomitrium patens TaxID=3218 RepID=UPI000D15C1FD|nr:uncharacterized protein LOC112287830 isoform X2 [Physcomitrium patens]|eukprot:XP_024387096.1 uncharacterized protein LOC112287830 isoform X2 [Physcomitrella patens]
MEGLSESAPLGSSSEDLHVGSEAGMITGPAGGQAVLAIASVELVDEAVAVSGGQQPEKPHEIDMPNSPPKSDSEMVKFLETAERKETNDQLRDEVLDVMDEPPPRPAKRPRPAPENAEVDGIVQGIRNILFNLRYEDNARVSEEDEKTMRRLLQHHPKSEEKIGCGIDYIKCVKAKIAIEYPNFVDSYDAVHRGKSIHQA